MLKRIILRYRMRGLVIGSVCLPIIILVLAVCVLPVHGNQSIIAGSDSNEVTVLLMIPTLDISAAAGPSLGEYALKQDNPGLSDDAESTTDAALPTTQSSTGDNRLPRRSTTTRLATAGVMLVPLDKLSVRSISRLSSGEKADTFTEMTNSLGEGKNLLAGLGCLYLLGNRYDKDTASLALTALVNAGIATQGLKLLTGRERPRASNDAGQFYGPTFTSHNSFPSGHTSVAFAVATVLADRYPEHRAWYYGLATAVGWARIKLSSHFPSDVLVGAALGIHAGNNAIHDRPGFLTFRF